MSAANAGAGKVTNIAKGRTANIYRELGETGVPRSAGNIMAAPLQQLQGRQGIEVYGEMYYLDPIVGAIHFALEQVVKQASWDAEAASDKPKDVKAKKFLQECKKDMRPGWTSTVSDALTMLPFGFAPMEIVYKVRKKANGSMFDDGKIGWQKIVLRQQHTLDEWDLDKRTGEVKGMWQDKAYAEEGTDRAYLPFRVGKDSICKALLFKTKSAGGNPEGMSTLMNAYRPWYFRKRIEEIEGIGIERDLNGVPVLSPPENFSWDDGDNPDALAWAKKMVLNLRSDEYRGVIMPSAGWELKLLSATGSRQHNTSEIINRYDKRIAMTAIAQFIMLGMERVGSFALVKSLSALWLDAVDGYLTIMEEVINQDAVPSLFYLNPEFDDLEEFPKLKAARVNNHDIVDLSNLINVLASNNLVDFGDSEVQSELMRILKLPQSAVNRSTKSRSTLQPAQPVQPAAGGAVQGAGAKNAGAASNKSLDSKSKISNNKGAKSAKGLTRNRRKTGEDRSS